MASAPHRQPRTPSRFRTVALTILVPLTTFGAIAIALSIVRRPPAGLLGAALTFVFGLSMLWILTSVLWPARAERTCPRCSERSLERLDANATHGIRCNACGFVDADQSSWLMAEEEGPLEELVLEGRGRGKRVLSSGVREAAPQKAHPSEGRDGPVDSKRDRA